jgi:hypothetical protein
VWYLSRRGEIPGGGYQCRDVFATDGARFEKRERDSGSRLFSTQLRAELVDPDRGLIQTLFCSSRSGVRGACGVWRARSLAFALGDVESDEAPNARPGAAPARLRIDLAVGGARGLSR